MEAQEKRIDEWLGEEADPEWREQWSRAWKRKKR